MTTEYSIQKMVSDGTLSTIALGIQYLQRNDIYMRIAGEETPQSGAPSGYTWYFLDNTTLKILPVIPNGVEVVVYRRTDVDAMYNIYSQNAQFDEATIDENNQQLLYIAQEYLEQGLSGAGVDTIEFLRDDDINTYYRIKRTDGSYSEEFAVPSASSSTKVLTRESLRRSYAESGLLLEDGSCEAGATLTAANSVVLYGSNGKVYSHAGPYPFAVAAGTDPSSGGFVDESGALLSVNLLAGALQMRDSRFALRDVVSIEDFDDATDTAKFANAFSYLTSNFGGGAVIVPPKVWIATVDVPSNIMLIGFGEKSVIRAASTGSNSYAVKISNSSVGVYPYGDGKTPVKNAKLQNLNIDANGADFGLYAAYCLFPDWEGVNISNAKVRNLYMAAVFSYSIDKMLISSCQSVGGSIGENIFGWTGGDEGIICNSGNSRRLIAFGNGTAATYNKVTAPTGGAGLIVRGGSGNGFTSLQGEQNKGPGLYVMPGTQASFHGIYLEANANDGTSEFRQVVNESAAALFYDVEPRFNSTDVFYAATNSYIFNYIGARITGPGYVSLHGKFTNVTVDNPWVHTIKLSEVTAANSSGTATRHNILCPSYRSTEYGYKTGVYEMGVYITLRSTQTISSGKSLIVRPVSLTPTLQTLNVPAGTYADGDTIYMKFLNYNTVLEGLNAVNIGYGAGWVGIGLIDIGVYIKLMV